MTNPKIAEAFQRFAMQLAVQECQIPFPIHLPTIICSVRRVGGILVANMGVRMQI